MYGYDRTSNHTSQLSKWGLDQLALCNWWRRSLASNNKKGMTSNKCSANCIGAVNPSGCVKVASTPAPLICSTPMRAEAVPACLANPDSALPAAAPKVKAKPMEARYIGNTKCMT